MTKCSEIQEGENIKFQRGFSKNQISEFSFHPFSSFASFPLCFSFRCLHRRSSSRSLPRSAILKNPGNLETSRGKKQRRGKNRPQLAGRQRRAQQHRFLSNFSPPSETREPAPGKKQSTRIDYHFSFASLHYTSAVVITRTTGRRFPSFGDGREIRDENGNGEKDGRPKKRLVNNSHISVQF